jgi:hypothetical protein
MSTAMLQFLRQTGLCALSESVIVCEFNKGNLAVTRNLNIVAKCLLTLLVVFAAAAFGWPSRVSVFASTWSTEEAKSRDSVGQSADKKQESDEKTEDEDQAPAAIQIDTSKDSQLIQVLYKATRETKEQPTLNQLEAARQIIQEGGDVNFVDAQGRTALHWAVFGSSYAIKPKIIVGYEQIADLLIQHGVRLNHEDAYNDTALDYLLYSPNFEMQTLLLEHGATSGFLAASFHFFETMQTGDAHLQQARVAASMNANLSPGLTIPIQLETPAYSDQSRTGDPIEGVVTAPVYKDGDLVLAPGTKIDGTILLAQKAPDKYSRPRIVLDFSNIVYKDGQKTPLYSRVIEVDNARETVRNNEILGIVQPHASSKVSLALSAVGVVNPIAGYAVKGVQSVYGLSIRREIYFPAGTDMRIQVIRPSMLKEKETWAGWPELKVTPDLQKTVKEAPLRTQTKDKIPSDLTNVMFIGTEQQVEGSFQEAGWTETDELSAKTGLKTFQATLRQSGYSNAPVSLLLLNGAPPDTVFQKGLDTLAKRHHIRVYKQTFLYQGREVWVGAATHDIALGNGKKGTKWFHRIDPHVDRERDWIKTDLLFAGVANGYAMVDRPGAPRKAGNATGDEIVTDGKMLVLQLGSHTEPVKEPTSAALRPGK